MRARLWALFIAAALLAPTVPLVVWSLAQGWRYPSVLPEAVTARGLSLVTRGETLAAIGTSLSIGACVALASVLIGLPAGRALGTGEFRGRRVLQFVMIAPVLVPGLAVTLGLQLFFIRLGLTESWLGVILVQLITTVPYATLLLSASFEAYDLDYERQARALGAGRLRTLMEVTVPGLQAPILATGLLTFLVSWSEYILTLLIGGGQVQTLPLLLFSAIGSSDTTAAAALGLVMIIPPVVLLALVARFLRTGSQSLLGWSTA